MPEISRKLLDNGLEQRANVFCPNITRGQHGTPPTAPKQKNSRGGHRTSIVGGCSAKCLTVILKVSSGRRFSLPPLRPHRDPPKEHPRPRPQEPQGIPSENQTTPTDTREQSPPKPNTNGTPPPRRSEPPNPKPGFGHTPRPVLWILKEGSWWLK